MQWIEYRENQYISVFFYHSSNCSILNYCEFDDASYLLSLDLVLSEDSPLKIQGCTSFSLESVCSVVFMLQYLSFCN